jgi:hypothetical protein
VKRQKQPGHLYRLGCHLLANSYFAPVFPPYLFETIFCTEKCFVLLESLRTKYKTLMAKKARPIVVGGLALSVTGGLPIYCKTW